MKKALLGTILWCLCFQVWAEEPFRDNRPESYTVIKGDTLWGIASRFLEDPWKWPEVWEINPQINNPHLIYPGDVVALVYINGKPRLTVKRGETGRTIKLGPKVRSTPIEQAIPSIPLEAINSFLDKSRILSGVAQLKAAPYILSSGQERIISGVGDELYARGNFKDGENSYGVYRGEKHYKDPKTGELLGTMVQSVGTLHVSDVLNDVATMTVVESSEEVRVGDKLLVSEERNLATSFFPGSPDKDDIEGQILDVIGGVNQIGVFNNVLINLGEREQLKEGDVLAIYRSNKIRDRVTKDVVQLPPKRVGSLMVFRTYEKISFAVVMAASQPLRTGDILRAP